MAITTFKRYEKKYLLDKEKYELLVPRLLEYMNYDEHCLNGKDYSIFNIYYDTKDNKIIEHSLSKPYYKEKLRLRSYKPIKSKDDKVFLEIKKKINGIVSKRRVVLTLEQVNNLLEFGERPNVNDYMSNIEGVFAGGDVIGGLLQVSKASSDGANAAFSINKYLKSRK